MFLIDQLIKQPQKAAGIIAEYNPFHTGHAHMIRQLRERGFDTILCVMSGPFVQRAEPALLPTATRARAAILGGADLVFRLPVVGAIASAEAFGFAGASLIAALGCVDTLAFGAETPDTDRLMELAALLGTPAFSRQVKRQLAEGVSFATARALAADTLLPGAAALLRSPNNILAVEYCKALQRIPNAPWPLALPRVGARHDGAPVGGHASASWLRGQMLAEGVEAVSAYVPEACMPIYKEAWAQGDIIDPARWEISLLSRLRTKGVDDFARYPGAGEGLGARLAKAARQAVSLEELYAMAKSKRFAHSRVRRLALFAALDIHDDRLDDALFLHLLAANKRGLAFLKQAKPRLRLPLSASLAKLGRLSPAVAQEALCEDLHALCLRAPKPGGGAYRQPLVKL